MFPPSPLCESCGDRVHFAEKIHANGNIYHKFCLKCSECKKMLDPSSVNDHEDKLFCNVCHKRKFGIKGYGFAAGGSGLSTDGKPNFVAKKPQNGVSSESNGRSNGSSKAAPKWGGGGEMCITCGKTVYQSERIDCNNQVYHQLCLKCSDCGKMMTKGAVNVHADKIYCRGCYTRSYGTKGFVAGTSMHAS